MGGIKRRGLASPDDGDALALTFAYPVVKRAWVEERRLQEGLKALRRRWYESELRRRDPIAGRPPC